MSAPRWRSAGARSLAVGLAVLVLATIESSGVPTQAKGKGRDLSVPITAVRGAQIAAESSMRAADKRISTLRRAQKGARRHLRRRHRRHDRAIDRRAEVRTRGRSVHAELGAARTALARDEAALATLTLEQDVLETAIAASSAASVALAIGPTVGGVGTRPMDEAVSPDASDDDPAVSRLEGSIAGLERDVARLQVQARQADRTTRQVERTTRRAGRRESAAKRRIRSIRAGIRAATGQQRGSEASLAAYIHSMTRLAHLRAAKKTKGKNRPDFIMPVHGRLTQGYHAGHDGLDIAAGQGTPIRAMAHGVIAYIGWNPWDSRPRAFVVVIAHQGGYETKYGHLLPRRGVTLGELVRRGEVIGYMGNTGHSTGVHLHLEVSRGFRTMNPYSIL